MERVNYNIGDRDVVFASLRAAEKVILEEARINLDAQGVPQTCYCLVVDAPPEVTTQTDLLAEADTRILELEYELCLAKGGI